MQPKIAIPYGRKYLDLDPRSYKVKFDIYQPGRREDAKVASEHLLAALKNPIGSLPLNEIIKPDDSVCIVTCDGTRPFGPMRFMLHGIFEHLGFIPKHNVVITGSGSHRPHTEIELKELFCSKLYDDLNIIAHDSRSNDNIEVGRFADGTPISMNRHYVEADKRIVLGHIEPHFFSGFTGGAKGIAPAICGIETIHQIHSFAAISDPSSRSGSVDDNTSARLMQQATACCPPNFLVNVVLNKDQEPAGIYAGGYIEAHRAGIGFCCSIMRVESTRKYPIVITSNGGWPLDQNLYQAVKGIDAAQLLTEAGGTIIIVAECGLGIPKGSSFELMLQAPENNETLMANLSQNIKYNDDRWQVQRLLQIIQKFRVILVSSLSKETTRSCRLEYAPSLERGLESAFVICDGKPAVAVLPYGPQTLLEMLV